MKTAQHILVASSLGEQPSNIAFLLKIAGFRVSIFADELEACNWLLHQGQSPSHAQMLLLHEPQAGRSLYALLFQIRQRFPHLELLLAAMETIPLSGQITELEPPVHQCRPNEIHTKTRQIFGRSDDAATDTTGAQAPTHAQPGVDRFMRVSNGIEREEQ